MEVKSTVEVSVFFCILIMEFGEEKILDDNFSDLTLAGPYSVDDVQLKTKKHDKLIRDIQKNVWGYDLILCLFVTALNSYRADRCLRPFPSLYVNEEGKNFSALRYTCDNIPPIDKILSEENSCSKDVNKILEWLFLEKGYPVVRKVHFDDVQFPSKVSKDFKPRYVFQVFYNDKFEMLWEKRKCGRDIILAYHGSALDNFYSILKVGLQQHFSVEKEGLFGNGIYLSSELSLSAHYAPFGQAWKNSALGTKLSVIAICEIINDIDKVKCKDSKNKRRSQNENSLGEIPEKYFIVTDSDMVRVKYLMVYRQKGVFSMKSFLSQNFFILCLVLYFVTIVAIGVSNNTYYIRMLKKFLRTYSPFS